jgi:hypothetical protein
MDATASEKNLVDSLKKYLLDDLEAARGLEITFDPTRIEPNTVLPSTTEWITVVFGDLDRSGLASFIVDFYICTRKDPEGYRMTELSDAVFDCLTDAAMADGKRRITLYNGLTTAVGSLLVHEILEGGHADAPDKTKFKIITARLRWAIKA